MQLKNKKITFIGQKGIPAEFAGTSGIEFYVESLAKKLVKQENQVTCYVRNWATPKSLKVYQKIKLVHLPSINTKHLDAFSHTFLASIHICFTDTDIVWYQAIGPAFFTFLPKLFGKKVYTTIHGLDWQRTKWEWWTRAFLRFCENILVRFSDKIFVVSRDLQNYYWKKYHLRTFYQSLTVPKLKKIKPNIITKKYGLKGNDYLLFMGRFVPEKRVDWIIKAYQKIKPKKVKLVLSGGSSHSDSYVRYLYRLAANNKNIIFPGYIFGKEKQELLSNCRLFILPSILEGSPVVLFEVLNYKIPCLLSDLKTSQELTKKNFLVKIFRKNSFVEFTKKLRY